MSRKPIDPRNWLAMNGLADLIDQTVNGDERGDYRLAGFVLLVFPWGEADSDDKINYISNVERDEGIRVLRSQLRFLGGGE